MATAVPVCASCGALARDAGSCARCGPALATDPRPRQAPAVPSHPRPILVPRPVPPPKEPVSDRLALAALLLNIFVWPGLGSLVARARVGWAQGFLALSAIFFGFPVFVVAWVWGIITGAQLMRDAAP